MSPPTMSAVAVPERAGRSNGWLVCTIIALTIVGYPLAGLFASALGLESTQTSIPLRLLVVSISVFAIIHVVGAHRFRINVVILLFWWLYLLRLLFDLETGLFEEAGEVLIFFLAVVVIPASAVMIGAVKYDEGLTARLLFVLGTIVCAGSVLLDSLGMSEAASLTELTGRLSFQVLNPITLGHVAASTVIAALTLWRNPQLPGGRAALAAGMATALVCLMLAASRGPVLALMVALISFSVLRGRWGRIFAAGLAVLIVGPMILASQGVEIIDRFTNIDSDLSARERLLIQANAFEQALTNPIWGSAYTELVSGQYPHNLILEAFMALGLVGGGLFLFICGRAGLNAALRLRGGEVLIPVLFVQYFVGAQFSSSLWGAEAFWTLAVLLTATWGSARRPLTANALPVGEKEHQRLGKDIRSAQT